MPNRLASRYKDDIKLDVMGELRHYRRSIVHAGGKAEPELARNTYLPRFSPGETIVIKPHAFIALVFTLKRGLKDYATQLAGHAA